MDAQRLEHLKDLIKYQELLVENTAKHLKNLRKTLRSLRKTAAAAAEQA